MDFPCVIKHAGDDELVFVAAPSELENEEALCSFDYDDGDFLIDSSGAVYGLEGGDGQAVRLVSQNSVLALREVLGLVKAHAAAVGSCCVAKLYAPTIADAFMIVKSMEAE